MRHPVARHRRKSDGQQQRHGAERWFRSHDAADLPAAQPRRYRMRPGAFAMLLTTISVKRGDAQPSVARLPCWLLGFATPIGREHKIEVISPQEAAA